MPADRTLLSVTLAATFAAGAASGWAARDRRAETPWKPTAAESVYAPQLRALRDRGYDEAELREAVAVHQRYLDGYQGWWREFLDAHAANLDQVDRRFESDLEALDARVRARLEGKAGR